MSVYTATLLEDQARRARVADMMRAGDWRGVINTFQGGEVDRDPLLVWIRPSIDLLLFIKEELRQLGLSSLSSVGCEWLLQEAVQLRVTGYEVNRSWWEGPNSIPHFIDIKYCDELEDRSCSVPSDSALMFCYFNNIEYFTKYLHQYKGPCLILIGPCEGASRHCEPSPLHLQDSNTWRIHSKLRLEGDDLVVVYTRRGQGRIEDTSLLSSDI